MRHLFNATLFAALAFSFQTMGCAESVTLPEPTTTGTGGATGGSGGEGGTGGVACVAEVCDGEDNNCDGVVDEGCECAVDETETCYTGPAVTADIGICKSGMRTCDAKTNKFGPCMGEVLPAAAEACNGQDDNCDGTIDNGIADLECGIGGCAATAPACVNGQPGMCVAGMPSQELCDGIDNNCNQLVAETFPDSGNACNTGVPGICAAGTMQCVDQAPVCVQTLQAGTEACDDLDNNCDGMVDNGIVGTGGDCSTGAFGVCGPGTISCQGQQIDCFSVVPASAEICDLLDNDCDGVVDDGNPEGGGACNTGQLGACAVGTLNCMVGDLVCTPNATVQVEVCDGSDNNCNGATDEGNPGAGMPCSCGGATVCSAGQLFCQGCTKEVDCNNGLDDDGDGATDCADSQCALGCDFNVGACPAGQKLLVLSSTDVPKTIADNSTVMSVINFSEVGTVQRVVLQFNITHTFDGDLDIVLKSPNNTSVDVTSDNGSTGENYTNTIFNDTCATSVVSGSAPFAGCYFGEQPMSTFNGQALKGTWTLAVGDDAGSDTGSLSSWSLAMCITQ